ncbi:hypothetical protein HXX76_000931 [Chlamydomonas incerta]|uniref:Uncharacterized protein n=1 Tax=Chlamydomonas incerta TaxID=51695 RepID=A0A835WFE1_CHLIN|nr:hypothetical protein HXX76_000931 [Chlamydomonas incerta]|eukprot:KAG2446343.1 hypothetical protein HXX76_000931 [Chlamydomonas incerta]
MDTFVYLAELSCASSGGAGGEACRGRGGEDYLGALEAAAESGRQDVCAWLLAHGWGWHLRAAAAAARRGHLVLLHWLMRRRPPAPPPPPTGVADGEADGAGRTRRSARLQAVGELLAAVAWGCQLAEFQRWYEAEGLNGPGGLLQPGVDDAGEIGEAAGAAQERFRDTVLAAATASPLSDWHAKAQWLLAPPRSYQVTVDTLRALVAAARSDAEAAERLAFLGPHCRYAPHHGWDADALLGRLADAAIRRGFAQALGWVMRMGLQQQAAAGKQREGEQQQQQQQQRQQQQQQRPAAEEVVASAVTHNQVACLQALEAAGVDMRSVLRLAVASRRLEVVRWALSDPLSARRGGRGSCTPELLAAASAAQDVAIFRALWRHLQRGGSAGGGGSSEAAAAEGSSDCGLAAEMAAAARERLRDQPHLREWMRQQVELLRCQQGGAREDGTGRGPESGSGDGSSEDEELLDLVHEAEAALAQQARRREAVSREVGASKVLICAVS